MQLKNFLTLYFAICCVRRVLICLLLFGIELVCAGGATLAQTKADSPGAVTLKPNESHQEFLAGGEIHAYRLPLPAKQFVRVIVNQKDIDVVVTLSTPDGQQLVQSDRTNGAHGPETISFITATRGVYRLQVSSLERITARGRYEIRLENPRAPEAQDEIRINAERASIKAEQLRVLATAAALRQAVAEFHQAVTLWRSLEEKYEEAVALYGQGLCLNILGDNQAAINAFQQSLRLSQTLDNSFLRAAALTGEGWAWLYLGENEKALSDFSEALKLTQMVENRRGLGIALYGTGWAYANLDKNTQARESFTASLHLRRQMKDRRGEALTLAGLGKIQSRLGDAHAALTSLMQALQLVRELGDRYGESDTLSQLGWVYLALNQTATAIDYFQQALGLRRQVGDQIGEALTRYGLARALRRVGQLNEARLQTEQSLQIVESTRNKIAYQQFRASFFVQVQDYYGFYIELLMALHQEDPAQGYAATAFQVSQRARARSLLDYLAESGADLRRGISQDLLQQEREAQRAINIAAERQRQLLGSKNVQEQTLTAQELTRRLNDYQIIQEKIRTDNPQYAALTQPQPLTTTEIQQLLDENTLLLEYALGEERSWLWVVSPTAIKSFALPKRAEIEQTARQFYQLLTARNQSKSNETAAPRRSRVQQADAEFAQTAAHLSQMILAPAAAELGQKRLLLITQGALQYIPFAALPEPRTTQPLVIHHELASLPSASILALLRRDESRRKPTPKTIAVFADPVFSSTDERVQTWRTSPSRQAVNANPFAAKGETIAANPLLRALEDLQPEGGNATVRIARLSGTRWEAEKIGAMVPAAQKLVALDFQANRDLAMSGALSQYRILHFASHAFINTIHPELSGIVLSLVDKQGNAQDGFLRANEIYNLKLPAELVVLSACQTGLGRDVKGEGLIGLTQSFMYAGAPRLIVSLWALQDKATADLMARFYQHLLGSKKLAPAAALRAAQVEMWQTKRWPSPYFWAGFVLQGEYR